MPLQFSDSHITGNAGGERLLRISAGFGEGFVTANHVSQHKQTEHCREVIYLAERTKLTHPRWCNLYRWVAIKAPLTSSVHAVVVGLRKGFNKIVWHFFQAQIGQDTG